MHDLNALRRKIASARQEVRNLTVIGLRPDLQPHHAELVRNLEISARAEVTARAEASGSRPQDADPGQVTAPSHEELPPPLIDKAGNIRLDKLDQPEDINQVYPGLGPSLQQLHR